MQPLFYSTGQVARQLGTTLAAVRVLCENRVIAAETTPGGHLRVPASEVERLKRDGVPPIPRPLPTESTPPARNGTAGRYSFDSELLPEPSDEVVSAADEVAITKSMLEKRKIEREIEETEDFFRDRQRQQAAAEAAERQRIEVNQAEQRRLLWMQQWTEYALNSLPYGAQQEVELEVHTMVQEALSVLQPSQPEAITRRLVDAVVCRALNPRTHSDEQVAQIAASIREFGFVNPILIGQDGVIIAGEGRLRAARMQGMREVPVIVLEHLSEVQRRALALADNQLALNSGWDEQMLGEQLVALRDQDFNLDILGFHDEELARRLAKQEAAAGLTDEDEVPDVPTDPVTRPGDLWLLGTRKGRLQHKVLCGDATAKKDITRLLTGKQLPILMVTDPPYGVDLEPEWREEAGLNPRTRQGGKVANDNRIDWSEAWVLFPGDVAYVWHAGIHAAEVTLGLRASGFKIRSQIVWVKQHFAISRGAYHWKHEPCWYAVRQGQTGHWRGDRTQSTVWEVANLNLFGGEGTAENEATGHGTQKPVEIMRRPILNHLRPREACYDPFLGSGSTLIAAESTGRICYGMDIDAKYVDVAVLRWQRFSGQQVVLDGDGRTFEEIARVRRREVA